MEASFPMYVLPVDAVHSLQRIPPHEEARHLLRPWSEGMVTLFVSHTWLSSEHPDNSENSKLKLLQAFLRSAGSKDIHADYTLELAMGNQLKIPAKRSAAIAYVWLDYWSIPQANRDNQARAIESIHTYIARSSFFACVAGAWVHKSGAPRDLAAWTKRGWSI